MKHSHTCMYFITLIAAIFLRCSLMLGRCTLTTFFILAMSLGGKEAWKSVAEKSKGRELAWEGGKEADSSTRLEC